ncbi:MAG: DEAD/DEAH box helicase [Deltaproteobacteria bacterium]|nr:MAG: DEAD/DEAH box helicase [Deltaproteobacteria bacterium]
MPRNRYRPRRIPRERKRPRRGKNKVQRPSQLFRPRASRQLKPLLERIGVPRSVPFVPDPFQREALAALEPSDVLVTASTGSGKTWIAQKAMEELLLGGGCSWYASPLKALSNSKYAEFRQLFGDENVGILTGDRKENSQAPIIVGTTEILRNQLYDAMSQGEDFGFELVVLDEAHYLGDEDRGVVWEEVMIYLPARVRLLLLSATISNAVQLAGWLERLRRVHCQVVAAHERPVPLHPLFMFPSGEVTPLIQRGTMAGKIRHFLERNPRSGLTPRQGVANFSQIITALRHLNLLPAIFFLKSRADCNLALQASLPRLNSKESDDERRRFHKRLRHLLQKQPYLQNHRQLPPLRHGRVAAHHGGQLPHWKALVETLMKEGMLEAIFSTSTVAAGVNFPARSVVLSQSDRFNGREFVALSATDLLQMTGRAGRRGMDQVGFVIVLPGPYQDPRLIFHLLHASPEPIDSQIQITFSMVLNLLLSHRPEEIKELLSRSFATYQDLDEHRELLEESQNVEKELAMELETGACGDLDELLFNLSRKRELERQLEEARRDLRWKRNRLLKLSYLNPGRLFRNKKGELLVTLTRATRKQVPGVVAVRVRPRPRLRRGHLRERWLQLDKVDSLLKGCFDLDTLDTPERWNQTLDNASHDTFDPLLVKEPLPSPESEEWKALKVRVEDLIDAIAALPCGHCTNLSQCEPKKTSTLRKKINRALTIRYRLGMVSDRLWNEFDRHFRFLQEQGYLDAAGHLSEDGIWASQLRLDQPLLIAESIRLDVFPHRDPVMLAALIAPFVSDRDSYGESSERPDLSKPALRQAFAKMVQALRPLQLRLHQQNFTVHPISIWPAITVHGWVLGAEWEEVLKVSGLDEGDLAMLIYRTADSLRQMEGLTKTHPRLASSATEAIQRLLREPVLVPT